MKHNLKSLGDKLWSDYEAHCQRLLREALREVSQRATWDQDEDSLNRQLYKAIIRASHAAVQRDYHVPAVVYEGRNPPAYADEERAKREFKRPDFYWAYIDQYASDPNDAAKQFVVECKRLTRRRAHYSKEYVESGVCRFITKEHGYAMGMPSGAMVAYLQDIHLDDALERVNLIAVREVFSTLVLIRRRGEKSAELEQTVDRPFAVSPFHLIHIWSRMGGRSPT